MAAHTEELFNASAMPAGWACAIHTVVHRLGRHFGFQAWNVEPRTQGDAAEVWTPATIFVAADHLHHLLVANLMRRDHISGGEVERFAAAVERLHDTIFEGFQDWCLHVGLPERTAGLTYEHMKAATGALHWEYLLEELALWFLLYTEAANLRHLPEGLWFLFWVLRNSATKITQVSCPPPTDARSANQAAFHGGMRGLADRRTHLRNAFARQIAALRKECGEPEAGAEYSVQTLGDLHTAARQLVVAQRLADGSSADADLLAEMVVYGDAGVFLTRVVSPVFRYLAVQVDKLGGQEREVAQRVAYDDCNESFTRRDVVQAALAQLGVKVSGKHITCAHDPWDALLSIGYAGGLGADAVAGRKARAAQRAAGGAPSDAEAGIAAPKDADWDCNIARDWWSRAVFGKTWMERRSLLAMYRAFFRVFAFHILCFQLLACIAWGGNLYVVSTVLLTHAGLSLVEQFAAVCLQRPPVGKGSPRLHGHAWRRHLWGLFDWAAINTILWICFFVRISGQPRHLLWGWAGGIYLGLCVAHAVLTTRPGYTISLTYSLASLVDRCCCGSPGCLGGVLQWLLRRIGASSARPDAEEFLMPYTLQVDWSTFLPNVAFWAVVITIKVVFDWYAVIKPLEGPVMALQQRHWLTTERNTISIAGHDTGWKFISADFVLQIARLVPAVLTTFVDTGIFYQLVSAVVGAARALVQLNLGVVASFHELRLHFHKAPAHWWRRCTSTQGAHNVVSAIKAAAVVEDVAGVTATIQAKSTSAQPKAAKGSSQALREKWALREQHSSLRRAITRGTTRDVVAALHDDRVAMWIVFADTWNAIVDDLRSVDLLSNSERDCLSFVHLPIDDTIEVVDGMRPFLMPVFFYAGQVAKACEVPGASAGQLVALTEMRALLVWLLLQLRILTRDQADAVLKFEPVEQLRTAKQRSDRLALLSEATGLLRKLTELQAPGQAARKRRASACAGLRDSLSKICNLLATEIAAVKDQHTQPPDLERGRNSASRQKHGAAVRLAGVLEALRGAGGALAPEGWAALATPGGPLAVIFAESADSCAKQAINKVVAQLLRMLEASAAGTAPRGEEARRALSFFLSSLKNPTLERPPALEDMLSFNTLTPHYEEDVIYALSADDATEQLGLEPAAAKGLADLLTENEDNISVMTYLRSIYPGDWGNLLERLGGRLGGLAPGTVTEEDFAAGGPLAHLQMELQLWASYRGQLLARTVRGMMAYEDALRLVATMEHPRPAHVSEAAYEAALQDVVSSKFTYIVASQVYGKNRGSTAAKARWLARGMDMLLAQYPALRCAYMDNLPTPPGGGSAQAAVLIRSRPDSGAAGTEPEIQEVYRVRLPVNTETGRGVVLGEGKPENQNASIIFAFGELLQAIDMNQDNNLAEALKMRNLVSEFVPHSGRSYDKQSDAYDSRPAPLPKPRGAQGAVSRRPARTQHVALVGFREWIFSQDSGALASFAAATEFTFGTIVQRVMAWPGGVRFHYGHPDVWNKLFVMTRGGVSKATRGFHISEDVFAGYNHVLRGGAVKFKEYIAVGKGRDMGFDSINSFESKVAGGNGEQVMSRDVLRLGTRVDFFRLMAWYHTGPGFFVNAYLTMLSVWATVWVFLLLALTRSQTYVDSAGVLRSAITGESATYSATQAVQLGMLSILTYAVELLLETGILNTLALLAQQVASGSIAFFIFRARTTAYFFKQDVMYGGAKYIPTGRGYALRHNSFVKVYTSYARSHMYFAAEVIMLLVLLALISTASYGASVWGPWLVAGSILIAPFWFNPRTFSMTRTKADYSAWRLWMSDVQDPDTHTTWYSWNKGQLEKARNDKGTLAAPWLSALSGLAQCLPTVIITAAAVVFLQNTRYNRFLVFGGVTATIYTYFLVLHAVRAAMLARFYQRGWRLVKLAFLAVGLALVILFITFFVRDSGDGVHNAIIIAFVNFQILVLIIQVLLYLFPNSPRMRRAVDASYRMLDFFLGYSLFACLFVLSFLQIVGRVQSALLFNITFAKSIRRGHLLQGTVVQSWVDRALAKEKQQQRQTAPSKLDAMAVDAVKSSENGLKTKDH